MSDTDDGQVRPTSARMQRAKRDAQVLQLWLAGRSYRAIGEALGMSHVNVDRVVRREMAKANRRRAALADQALEVYIERSEALLAAHFGKALQGDYKASLIVDRVMARQARLYGLNEGGSSGSADPEPLPTGDDDDAADEVVTEFDKYRRRHGLA